MKASQLYDQDFVLWAAEQAAMLRRSKGSNLPLDWDNLAEEIESLGKSQRTELNSQIRLGDWFPESPDAHAAHR